MTPNGIRESQHGHESGAAVRTASTGQHLQPCRPGNPLAAEGRPPDPEPGPLLVHPVLEERLLTLLVGEADFSTAVGLHRQLVDAMAGWPYTVVIDVSGLTFCGLAGLDALREAELVGAAQGREVRVTGMSRQLAWLRRNFGQTGAGLDPNQWPERPEVTSEAGSSPSPEGEIVRPRLISGEGF
ncbi:MAG: hypothetical protein QOJ11_1069 [Frankiales bacterium]|jgi:anti-anti-sigma regulatory factor|nr:hypothetical protein [Frankiales bacterium]